MFIYISFAILNLGETPYKTTYYAIKKNAMITRLINGSWAYE